MTTVEHCPASMAWAARATYISNADPPANVESVHDGSSPRYSASWVAENRATPAVARPSTSDNDRPASARARVMPWACRVRMDLPVTPRSDSAAPTIAIVIRTPPWARSR